MNEYIIALDGIDVIFKINKKMEVRVQTYDCGSPYALYFRHNGFGCTISYSVINLFYVNKNHFPWY